MKIIKGDLLAAPQRLICHQVNCQGAMGSGVAKQIKDRYPYAYEKYKKLCSLQEQKISLLGTCQIIEYNNKRAIANLFGQWNYGYDGSRYTKYVALAAALGEAFREASVWYDKEIALPYKIGCDRGGADWNLVSIFIGELEEIYDVQAYVYKL
jgi:O-acetyl-ADP-ribose deacetylase (regulator of RNase III)